MANIQELIRKRATINTKLTFFAKFVSDVQTKSEITELDVIQLNERLNKIELLINEFDDIQNVIESTVENVEEELKERKAFEDNYYLQISLAKRVIKGYDKQMNDERSSTSSKGADGNDFVNQTASHFVGGHVKLPTIQLPKFSGEYADWLEFRDTYESLIHNNRDINEIQRFHYLRAALEGSAAQVIKSLEFTTKNYVVAWNALLDRYNNNRLLVQNHVKALFNIEPLFKESSDNLRKIIDSVSKNLRALEQLEQPTENWDTLIVYMVTSKLDVVTLREWENFKTDKNVPSFNDLKTFLKARADLLETLQLNQAEKKQQRGNVKGFLATENKLWDIRCKVCNKNHYIQNCPDLLKLPVDAKVEKILNLKLCLNCLRPGHFNKVCRRGTCKKCRAKHHTLLHNEKPHENISTATTLSSYTSEDYVLLSTAYVQVLDSCKVAHTIRALLDSGSQSSYITTDLCKRLNLSTSKANITIHGLNQTTSSIESACELTIQALHNNFVADIKCLVIPQITENLPSISVNVSEFKIPKNIKLADPLFFKPDKVEMLIGSNLFWSILSIGQLSLGTNKPILQKTQFDWVVSVPTGYVQNSTSVCNFSKSLDVQTQLARFWEIENNFLTNDKSWTKEEILCENHFKENVKRAEDDRFIVTVPLKESAQGLGDSYEHARRRFLSLEKKLEANAKSKERYSEFMSEYRSLGHMTKVENIETNKVCYYMPHHGVVREESLTTKLRVVFDASAPTSSGISLNNIQMKGPTLQSNLLSILLRFRQYRYVVSGDVEKMYRQILVVPEQRCLQRILWRENVDKPLEIFELNTVTYGTTVASFLAVRCLAQLAEENNKKQPHCSEITRSDFYMDDLLTGSDSVEEATSIAKSVSDVLKQGRFELRKFYSNDLEALKYVTENDCPTKIVHLGADENAKTLGLTWSPVADMLMYNIGEIPENRKITKLTILSSISQIFDPLGLLSPCIVKAKILLQQLWLEKLSWDERLPLHIHSFWDDYQNKLHTLNELRIKRQVICENPEQVEIHAFADASEKAYGGCVFMRSVGQDGKIHVNLLCAKTKVAPLKVITLPRLELLGALIAARLAHKVSNFLRTKVSRRMFWSDSTIVLGWLKLPPNKLKTFVSNKVTEIQELTSCDSWRHVPSKDNPADILSRGTMPNDIKESSLWWNGPPWLREREHHWPVQSSLVHGNSKKDLPETKNTFHSFNIQNEEGFPFNDFSSLTRLRRVVAWILRFANNCRDKTNRILSECLSIGELNKAFNILIKLAQHESFNNEIKRLRNHEHVHVKSKILNLNPFLDDERVLRVGGRLENSKFSYQKKHPILLSAEHQLTRRIIKNEHLKLLHAGPQQLLASVREEFWPIGGRNLCKVVVHECLNCFRSRPRFIQPIMGQLPEARVEQGPAFNITGVDYAGPLLIKDRKGRGAKLNKCYIGLFICLSTKAIHLEIISDLSKDSFIMALKRFVARRGEPSQILSDNGSNFVAASSEMKQLFKILDKDVINHCAQENIQWKFIPPYSPHFGRLWEAGVKASKFHLKRVLGNAHLTFEELYTVIVQIEAILNSRPLFPLSVDPNDLTPLTPAHFLVGRTLTAVPEANVQDIPVGRLSRFQHLQQCQQHFWSRWLKEYIAELQRRVKWKKTQGELKIESMVLLRDDNAPPLRWKLGRVTKVHPGRDGRTRVATVRTQTGETKRSFAKLCPLPIPDD